MEQSDISSKNNTSFSISNYLSAEKTEELVYHIFKGLSENQKHLSSRFFYDETGSVLFEEITSLPEYYPSVTEKAILKDNAASILDEFDKIDIIELGSGDCSKISVLLDVVPKSKLKDICYFPVDVSETAILKSADSLSLKYYGLTIEGLLADFIKHLDQLPGNNARLVCFFGSTLGNLNRKQSFEFLLNIKNLLRKNDRFLLGLDMVKDTRILHDAYNDSRGITALFNRNILQVINDIADTNFNPTDFEHRAFYNREKKRIEMHLEATKDLTIFSPLFPKKISIRKGETIHTENSHKYTPSDIQQFSFLTGLQINKIYTDSKKWFSLVEFKNCE